MNRGEAQARAEKSRGKKPAREKKQRSENARSLKQENARGLKQENARSLKQENAHGLKQENARDSKFGQKRIDPRLREGDDGNSAGNRREGDMRPENGMPRHKHRRNRPGSRARRRMRENGGAV